MSNNTPPNSSESSALSVGTHYLEARTALSHLLFELLEVASETKTSELTRKTLQSLQAGLKDPFLFVVVGEVKSGKSSLLNALFGQDFCRVDVLPATDKIYVFKYGETAQDISVGPHLMERYQPIAFLKDFNIVDTPGTNTIVADHQTITEQFVPQADVIIFVFSVINPWGASAWEFLSLLQKKWLKNVVFVLQQKDLREDQEVESIVSHLHQTAIQRLGQSIPIFALSAKKAYMAKTSASNAQEKEQLLKESAFEPFEKHINEMIASSEVRMEKLHSTRRTAEVILKEISKNVHETAAILEADREQLENLRSTIEQFKTQSHQHIEGFLRRVDQAYSQTQKQGEKLLEERLTFWATVRLIFRRDNSWQQEFQRNIESLLRTAVTQQLEHAVGLLENELKHVWTQVLEKLQMNFGPEARGQLGTGNLEFHMQRKRIVERIELTMVERLADDQIERQLQSLFTETATWMRVPAGTAVAGGIAAMLAAQMASMAMLDVTGILAAVTAITGTFVAVGKRRKILAAYREQMALKQEELTHAIGEIILQAIDIFYQRLSQLYQPLEAFCNIQEEQNRPLIARVEALEKQFQKFVA